MKKREWENEQKKNKYPGKKKQKHKRTELRILYLTAVLIILVFAASIWGYYYLKGQAHSILSLLDDLREEVEKGQWSKAEQIKDRLQLKWQEASSMFPVMIDHAEFHDLTLSLTRIFSLIEVREQKLLLPEVEVARELIKGIPRQQKLSLENIF